MRIHGIHDERWRWMPWPARRLTKVQRYVSSQPSPCCQGQNGKSKEIESASVWAIKVHATRPQRRSLSVLKLYDGLVVGHVA
eukprot:1586194-Prymnesium_polylepis.1